MTSSASEKACTCTAESGFLLRDPFVSARHDYERKDTTTSVALKRHHLNTVVMSTAADGYAELLRVLPRTFLSWSLLCWCLILQPRLVSGVLGFIVVGFFSVSVSYLYFPHSIRVVKVTFFSRL